MARAYQLRVTLEGVRPEVWRRLVVPGDLSLERLHDVIQDAMGWRRGHMHEFLARGMRIGTKEDEGWFREHVEDERQLTLERLYRGRGRFQYLYDFGDDWMHEVQIETIVEVEGRFAPRCVGGERACPPEDCGGVCEYLHMIDVLARPEHPDHALAREWLGDEWSPEAFDLEAADRLVARHGPQPEPQAGMVAM